MDEPIHVLFCLDSAYLPHFAAAAVSLAENARGVPIVLHVATLSPLPQDDLSRVRAALRAYGSVEPRFLVVSDDRVPDDLRKGYLTAATVIRLLAGEILPASVKRAIYLDCDLVVLGSIADLWRQDLEGRSVGVVADLRGWGSDEARFAKLGLGPDHTYFNTGVMLIDLAAWRRREIGTRALSFLVQRDFELNLLDQDALNAVLQRDVALLDPRWNLQALWFSPWARHFFPEEHADLAAARRDPGIIHYTTRDKPWRFRSHTLRKGDYFGYLDKTPWAGSVPVSGRAQVAEYRLARLLLRLGVDVYATRSVLRLALGHVTGRYNPGNSFFSRIQAWKPHP